MELFIFARFHAKPGQEESVADALRDVLAPTRAESGCLAVEAHRGIRDPQLFYIHSRWHDEAAFERHGGLPHTVRFIDRVQTLIDHPLEVTRTRPITGDQPGRAGVIIRNAVAEDALAACQVMRRSIAELCIADHHNDPMVLQQWLANKTPDIVASWIRNPANTVLVAVEDGCLLSVGLVRSLGEIELNYVSPDARFRGISRAMMAALEARAREQGAARCKLISTETARRFYQAIGYAKDGPGIGKFGTSGSYPMSKSL